MLCCSCWFQTVTGFRTFRPHWRGHPTKRMDVSLHRGRPTQPLSDRAAAAWSSLTKERQRKLIKSEQPTLVLTKWWYNKIFVDAIRGVVSMVSRRLSSVSNVLEVSIAEVFDFCYADGEVGINGAKMTSLIKTELEGGSEEFVRTCLPGPGPKKVAIRQVELCLRACHTPRANFKIVLVSRCVAEDRQIGLDHGAVAPSIGGCPLVQRVQKWVKTDVE